jgi:hypothetical protein
LKCIIMPRRPTDESGRVRANVPADLAGDRRP